MRNPFPFEYLDILGQRSALFNAKRRKEMRRIVREERKERSAFLSKFKFKKKSAPHE